MPNRSSLRKGAGAWRWLLSLGFLLSACASPLLSTPQATTPAETLPGPQTTEAATATSGSQGPLSISLWVPARFDPNDGSPAAAILGDRLDEFANQHPQVQISLRVKAEEGTGGLLDSLLTAHSAAPLALPDLVLLPNSQLDEAASRDILIPLSGLTTSMDSDDWYTFGTQMSQAADEVYGLPFAGDALVLAYRPTAIDTVPDTWAALQHANNALGFAAADPAAIFALAQLEAIPPSQAPEGQDLPLDQDALAAEFEFLANAREAGVFPYWLSQYEKQDQSWQAFIEGRLPMVAAWTSRVFDSRNVDVSGAPLPTQNGNAITLVKGWVWAISTPHDDRVLLAAELAEFLTEPEFMAQWTAAANLLPPRHSSLAAWSPDARQALASQIVEGAVALPQQADLDSWEPALSQAVIGLLKQELEPAQALDNVVNQLSNP